MLAYSKRLLNCCLGDYYLCLDILSFGTLFDADFIEFDEGDFPRYLMVCHPCLEVKASLERLKALTSKHG